jgi:nitrogen fixation protein FixH
VGATAIRLGGWHSVLVRVGWFALIVAALVFVMMLSNEGGSP